ncbi:HTH domain-containing protein [Bifidobacterium aerophilum]|uniref:HTH domain-containing protein n=1 Tax=Bifidobacterium aerophilum TaxID=1798155 RepID=UPI001954315A|nr:HTH domain-containing protein [Bifidobacterium aerophilum]
MSKKGCRNSEFSVEEMERLAALPAVEHVSPTRIYYTFAFQTECMRRYLDGDRPVDIFRDAGLEPRVIGYKRVERCIDRWCLSHMSDEERRLRLSRRRWHSTMDALDQLAAESREVTA